MLHVCDNFAVAMTTKIPQVDLFFDGAELAAVEESMHKRWLTEGPWCKAFQEAIRARTGSKHVLFAPNGTLGLFLALLGLDLQPGDEVLVPTFTFYGSATAAVFAGLKPVFVDVDPGTFNVRASDFEPAIGPRTRALMPVHIYGQSCDMEGIMALARKHGLKVVEDAAQALGTTLKGRNAGTFGDIGVFSTFSDKVITTGEGGILVTDSDELAGRLALLRNQGRPHAGTFVHPSLGMNFRITDLQAAIGVAQMKKLPQILADRAKKWNLYMEGLKGVGDLEFMQIVPGSTIVPFRFPILTGRRDALAKHLEQRGIQMRGFFYPMHLQPKLKPAVPQRLPAAERLHERGLCLPVYVNLTDEQIGEITGAIRGFFGG
jgi:perosamine synthetase